MLVAVGLGGGIFAVGLTAMVEVGSFPLHAISDKITRVAPMTRLHLPQGLPLNTRNSDKCCRKLDQVIFNSF